MRLAQSGDRLSPFGDNMDGLWKPARKAMIPFLDNHDVGAENPNPQRMRTSAADDEGKRLFLRLNKHTS